MNALNFFFFFFVIVKNYVFLFFPDPLKKGFNDQGIYLSDFRSFNACGTNTEDRQSHDLAFRAIEAVTVAFYVALETDMLGENMKADLVTLKNNEKSKIFGKIIMRHLQIYDYSQGVICLHYLTNYENCV